MRLRRKVAYALVLAMTAAACDSKPKRSHGDDDEEEPPRRVSASAQASASVAVSGSAMASTSGDVQTSSASASTSASGSTSASSSSTPAPDGCDAYFKALDCIASKMPGEVRDQMRKSFDQMKDAMRQVGAHAAPTCAAALEGMQPALKQQGCLVTTEPSPSVSGIPTVATAPTVSTSASSEPGARSPVPSSDEWGSVTREVTVSGSTKLNCETKQVREWIRVSCRDKNDTGGEPTAVSVTKGGGRGDDFTFASGGVVSLTYRFFEGQDLEAQFDWTDKSRVLVVKWPRGTPEPAAKGVFQ